MSNITFVGCATVGKLHTTYTEITNRAGTGNSALGIDGGA
jgi:hypothetical protein